MTFARSLALVGVAALTILATGICAANAQSDIHEGALVRVKQGDSPVPRFGRETVWLIADGKKRALLNHDTLLAMNKSDSDIVEYPEAILANIPDGLAMPPENVLLRTPEGDPVEGFDWRAVWFVRDLHRWAIPNPQTLQAMGYTEKQIGEWPSKAISAIPLGEGNGGKWPSDMTAITAYPDAVPGHGPETVWLFQSGQKRPIAPGAAPSNNINLNTTVRYSVALIHSIPDGPDIVPTRAQDVQDVKVSLDEFHVTEGGSFGGKLLSNINTPQFVAMVTAACAYWGVDCSQEASAAGKAAGRLHDTITGGDFAVSGHIDNQAGEEWRVMYLAPTGYSVCKASMNNGALSITGEATFNSTVVRDSAAHNGLGIYAVVPKNHDTGQWINAYMSINYVPAGTEAAHGCWGTNSHPWLCKGQNCAYVPGARM